MVLAGPVTSMQDSHGFRRVDHAKSRRGVRLITSIEPQPR